MAAVANIIRWCHPSYGMKAVINNIYSIGDYFFIDYSLQNKTKIPYDIEELRVKLTRQEGGQGNQLTDYRADTGLFAKSRQTLQKALP